VARLRRLAAHPGPKLGYDAQVTLDPANEKVSWSPQNRNQAREIEPGLDQDAHTLQQITRQLPIHRDHRQALLNHHYSEGPGQMDRFSRDLEGGSTYRDLHIGKDPHPDETDAPSDPPASQLRQNGVQDRLGRARDQLEVVQTDLLQQPSTTDQLGETEEAAGGGLSGEHLKMLLQICLQMCGGDRNAAEFMARDYLRAARDSPPEFEGMPRVGSTPVGNAQTTPQREAWNASKTVNDAMPRYPHPQGYDAQHYGGMTQYERESAYIADRCAQVIAQRHSRIAIAMDKLARGLPSSIDRYALATALIDTEDHRPALAMDAKRKPTELGKHAQVHLGYSPDQPNPQLAYDHGPVSRRALQASAEREAAWEGFKRRNPHAAKL
jgi:hypothetical protein